MQNVGPDDSHSVALGVPFLTPSVLVIALRCSIGGGAAAGRAQLDSVFKAEHCILWVKREGVGDEGLVGGACRQVVHRSPLPPRLSFLQVGFLSVEGDVGGGAALLIVLHAGVHTPPPYPSSLLVDAAAFSSLRSTLFGIVSRTDSDVLNLSKKKKKKVFL